MEQAGVRVVGRVVGGVVGGAQRGGVPAGRVPAPRPVTRDRRGPARPLSVPARGVALCPSPVVAPRDAIPGRGLLRRIGAGVGLAVASAVAVVGLGLISDVAGASAGSAPAAAPVPAVAQP